MSEFNFEKIASVAANWWAQKISNGNELSPDTGSERIDAFLSEWSVSRAVPASTLEEFRRNLATRIQSQLSQTTAPWIEIKTDWEPLDILAESWEQSSDETVYGVFPTKTRMMISLSAVPGLFSAPTVEVWTRQKKEILLTDAEMRSQP